MKSVASLKKAENEARTYPYIGVWPDGDMVLFCAPRTGTWIYKSGKGDNHKLGHYCATWSESETKPYPGSVTLSND
jgi:hypothetical protein